MDPFVRMLHIYEHYFITGSYVCIITQKKNRSAYAKFRCDVAPIKIETGRYDVNRVRLRYIIVVCNVVESEMNVMLLCQLYNDLRSSCLNSIQVLSHGFNELTLEHQYVEIIENLSCYRIVSKYKMIRIIIEFIHHFLRDVPNQEYLLVYHSTT